MARRNEEKAAIVYSRIDADDFYEGLVDSSCRSRMNLTFRLKDESLEKQFLVESEEQGLFGLKGHRLMGGFRASMYNAFPIPGVEALVDFLDDFEKRHG